MDLNFDIGTEFCDCSSLSDPKVCKMIVENTRVNKDGWIGLSCCCVLPNGEEMTSRFYTRVWDVIEMLVDNKCHQMSKNKEEVEEEFKRRIRKEENREELLEENRRMLEKFEYNKGFNFKIGEVFYSAGANLVPSVCTLTIEEVYENSSGYILLSCKCVNEEGEEQVVNTTIRLWELIRDIVDEENHQYSKDRKEIEEEVRKRRSEAEKHLEGVFI